MTDLTQDDIERDRLRCSMSLFEWIHFLRTGSRMPEPDPACRECRGTGLVSDLGYHTHAYAPTRRTGPCACIRNPRH